MDDLVFFRADSMFHLFSVVFRAGNMFLDDLGCIGNESSLVDCQHRDWGDHDCHNTNELAGVRCYVLHTPKLRFPEWNPLGITEITVKESLRMQKVS